MFPISDSTPRRSVPFVNYFIIFINIVVFIIQILSPSFDEFIYRWGFVPARFFPFEKEFYKHIFFSMWLHGGLFHLLSNMWFLHLFGDNVEDRFGHLNYLLFYIASGFAGGFLYYIVEFNRPNSLLPAIGASGAISGVAGAYFILFKRSTIRTWVPFQIINLPSFIFLGYWFAIQLVKGFSYLGGLEMRGDKVAWFAHIGGFLWGVFVANFVFKPRLPDLPFEKKDS